ncbi:MAG: hypothetical protein K2J63_11975 [Muribaculaceae bacterium]|nr:hypothetical protein [Muribaculaceae bacterium]
MAQYLYGAAVQGIQGFIFQTNKLKEIVGASELVEQICTRLFAELLYGNRKGNISPLPEEVKGWLKELQDEPKAIMNAAGNIKYIFDKKEECERIVRLFPKTVMQFAPGITVSQSVVPYENDAEFPKAVQKLEDRLRSQRNNPMRDLSIGLMGLLRSRDTGLPVAHTRPIGDGVDKKTIYMDSGTFHKLFEKIPGTADYIERSKRKETSLELCKKAFGKNIFPDPENITDQQKDRLPFEVEKMTGNNDWLAIIHADGNGLGQIVQKIGTDKTEFRKFSRKLDDATTKAAQRAFEEVIGKKLKDDDTIPMRPIVLSGDDHTVICRADLAIPYTEAFLKYFEKETKTNLGDILLGKKENGKYGEPIFKDKSDYLTACAGIAFLKSSFPFHFGYQLAEALCDRAKKDTKALYKATEGNLPTSCLMFHKIQDSFVSNFEDVAVRELRPQPNISFEFGPYYFIADGTSVADTKFGKAGRWSIKELINAARLSGKINITNEADKEKETSNANEREGNAVKSHLRNWLTLLHDDTEMAQQKLNRLYSITSPKMAQFVKSITQKPGMQDKTYVRREIIDKENGEAEDNVRFVYPVYDILTLHTINTQTTR